MKIKTSFGMSYLQYLNYSKRFLENQIERAKRIKKENKPLSSIYLEAHEFHKFYNKELIETNELIYYENNGKQLKEQEEDLQ